MYDAIIIGAGPAGVSASLYIKRANLNVLILYDEISSLEKSHKIDNYYGFEDGINGKTLYQNGINQAINLGIEVKKQEVIKIEKDDNDLYNVFSSIANYQAKSVILATGSKKNKPKIKDIEKFEGKGISYCAVCDAFFYRNKNVAVLGSGNYAISETNELLNIADNITILTNGNKEPKFRADNVTIDTRGIAEIHGKNRVEEIEFSDKSKMKTDGIFIAQGVAGSNDFAKKLGAIINKDKIVVNENMETNVNGLYACGDCTGGLLQISKAVYEGAKAGLQLISYVRQNKNKFKDE